MILLLLPFHPKHFLGLCIFQSISAVKQQRLLWVAVWTLESWGCRKAPSKLRAVKPFSSWRTPSIHLKKAFPKRQDALQSTLLSGGEGLAQRLYFRPKCTTRNSNCTWDLLSADIQTCSSTLCLELPLNQINTWLLSWCPVISCDP